MSQSTTSVGQHWLATFLLKLRNRHFLAIDLLCLLISPVIALLIRTESIVTLPLYALDLAIYIACALSIRISLFFYFGLYRRYWRYASSNELNQVLAALVVGAVVIIGLFIGIESLYPAFRLPRSISVLDALLSFLFIGGNRSMIRLTEYWRRLPSAPPHRQINTVIIGAGDTGEMIVRQMQKMPELDLVPVAFLDDDANKWQMQIHNVPVVGGLHNLPSVLRRRPIDRVIIAMPGASGKIVREIVDVCHQAGVQPQIMPSLPGLLNGSVGVTHLRNVQIEDLLHRSPIQTDSLQVETLLRGKRVMVTGGGGSIGSELCRQILRCKPRHLILVGHGENSIFEANAELCRILAAYQSNDPAYAAIQITSIVAELRFPERIQRVLLEHKPQIVFHAAAHKHVPLMEANPVEAITNNVLGTRNLLQAAQKAGVGRFVMISTDKAVNPTSMMGASKRVAEFLVHKAAQQSGQPYMVVRFGNVLGSRGSVVHTFRQQILDGGPVTVTDPEMKRYFMTIPEAVQLVLQAFVLGNGGEVFMLDMGEPTKIVDLARDLITLSGLEVGRDIEIAFTGLRPGEKLFEEMFTPGEEYRRTDHPKVLMAANASNFVPSGLDEAVATLAMMAQRNDDEAIVAELRALIPEYQPMRPTILRDKNTTQTSEVIQRPMGTLRLDPAIGG